MNERITVLSVGGKTFDVINRMSDGKVSDIDFAFTSSNWNYHDECLTFHVPDVFDCGDIVREKFSDTDVLFIISDSRDIFDVLLASAVSRNARLLGILTVGIIFLDYYTSRLNCQGFTENSSKFYDTVFFRFANDSEKMFLYAKRLIECISSLITKSGFINLDFANIKDVLSGTCEAVFSTGYFGGCSKCRNAAIEAVHANMRPGVIQAVKESDSILMNITTGSDITLEEIMEAVSLIEESAPNANVLWGHVSDDSMNDTARVSLIAKEDSHS